MSTKSAKPKVKKPTISKIIKDLDKEHKGEPSLWDAIVDANRSGSLHFGKSITFMYPATKEMREKIHSHPELIDNLIISRHMYFSEKTSDPESRWRCWIQFATDGEKVTATDSHMRVVANVSSATARSIELAGIGKLEIASSWDYSNNDQAFYMLTGTPDKIPKGKDRVFVEGAMEKEMLEGQWKTKKEEEMGEDHKNYDFRIKLEAFARTSLAYDFQRGFGNSASAYCQYVVSFLAYLEEKNKSLFEKSLELLNTSSMVSFYLIFFTLEDSEATIDKWQGSLDECCSSKEKCQKKYKDYLKKIPNKKSYKEYIDQLMSIKPASDTKAIVSNMEAKGWNKETIWRSYIVFKLTEFLSVLFYHPEMRSKLSTDVGSPTDLNYLISQELQWTGPEIDKLDRTEIITMIRNLPQIPRVPDEVIDKIKEEEEAGRMSDTQMTPVVDLEQIRKNMFEEFTL